MDRRFKQAMETVRMSEECRARIRGALEERSQLQEQPAGRTVRKRARLVVVIAVMLLLLIGSALAAVWNANLLRYFQNQTPNSPDGLATFFHPLQASETAGGWTATVEECIGDEDWVFLWLTLTAPEGTRLPELEKNESFFLQWWAEALDTDSYFVRDMVFDGVPGDNHISFALGIGPEFSPMGKTISLTVGPLEWYSHQQKWETLWDGEIVLENLVLDYSDTTTHLTPETEIPFLGQTLILTELAVSPFRIEASYQSRQPLEDFLRTLWDPDGLFLDKALPEISPDAPLEVMGWEGFLDQMSLEVRLQDGTVLHPKGTLFRFTDLWHPVQVWEYQEEISTAWNETYMVDPTQIEALVFNGVEVPFTFQASSER